MEDYIMNETVQIGKFTLESLTTGMYEQPLIIYREYLQNAADSLEAAQRLGIIDEKTMMVQVRVNTDERLIEIQDNGAGIPQKIAASVLMSVGKSPKVHTESRGFRGIGRLGGISYCDKLIFETTSIGEEMATKVTYDCALLKRLLSPGENTDMSMAEVIKKVCFEEEIPVPTDDHYFKVRLVDVDDRTELLDPEKVRIYLSQIAPVPYSPHFKMLSNHIYSFLSEYGVKLTEFPVQLSFDNEFPKPLTKPFSRRYFAGRGKSQEPETIYEIEKIVLKDSNDKLLALGWYGKGDWNGTLSDPAIRGLRLRMGNIQIGGEDTLDPVFRQSRFNGWCQGEIFVVSDELIPNARRDNFEQNSAYFELIEAIRPITDQITKQLTEASRTRNDPTAKMIDSSKSVIMQIKDQQAKGFNSQTEAQQAVMLVQTSIDKLKKAQAKKPELEKKKQEAVTELEAVLSSMDEVTPYKRDRLKGILSKKEMKVFNLAADILTLYVDDDLLNVIIDNLIDELLK